QLTPTMNIEIAYIGNKGTHGFAGNGPGHNANQAAIGAGSFAYSCSAPLASGPNAGLRDCKQSFKPAVPQSWRRRFNLNNVPTFVYTGDFAGLTCCATDVNDYFGNDASSHYNALQVKMEKRFAQGLQFLAHYTYAHAYNYNDDYFSVDPKF